MTLRLTLIANAATAVTRRAAFSTDEVLEPQGLATAAAMAGSLGRVDAAWTGPSLQTRQTAAALGLNASVDLALADIDLGRWAGRSLAEVAATDVEGLALRATDSTAAPHAGESVAELLRRVSPPGWPEYKSLRAVSWP
jgi:broad specificity phosphatase PhoE